MSLLQKIVKYYFSYHEATDDEIFQSLNDSKDIQRISELSTGNKGKISYFVADRFCKLHGEYNNWNEYRIHLAEVHLMEKLIASKNHPGMLSDKEMKNFLKSTRKN